MNEEIKNKLDVLTAKFSEVADTKATAVELTEIKGMVEKAANAEEVKAINDRLDQLDVELQKRVELTSTKAYSIVGDLNDQIESKKSDLDNLVKQRNGSVSFETKASTISPTGFSEVDSPDFVIAPGRRQTAKNVFPIGSMNTESYNQLQLTRTGMPALVAPGAVYPEIDGNPAKQAFRAEVVASNTKIDEASLADTASLQSAISTDLMRRHDITVDNVIYKGTGAAGQPHGLFTNATDMDLSPATIGATADNLDRLYLMLQGLEINSYMADAIVVSPSVYYSIVGLRDSNQGLVAGTAIQIENGIARFLGVPVYRSSALAANEGMAMEFSAFAAILQRSSATLELERSGDDFTTGLITMRLHERFAVAIKDATAAVASNDFGV